MNALFAWVTDNGHYILAYGSVMFLGAFTGAMELVARYRDNPVATTFSIPGRWYMVVNAGLSFLTLWIMLLYDERATLSAVELFELSMFAGLGSLLFFRAKLVNMRVGDSDISVGPSFILETLLTAIDNAVARGRSSDRDAAADEIMARVSFTRSREFLSSYCLALLNNVSPADEQRLGLLITSLAQADMPDAVKARLMGLYLLEITGEDVLRTAVKTLKPWLATEEDALNNVAKALGDFQDGDAIERMRLLCQQINPVDDDAVDELEITLIGIKNTELSGQSSHLAAAVEMMKVYGVRAVESAATAIRDEQLAPD